MTESKEQIPELSASPQGERGSSQPGGLAPSFFLSTLGALVGVLLVTSLWWSLAAPASLPHQPFSSKLKAGQDAFREAGCWYCHHPTLKGQRWGAGFGVERSFAWWEAYLRRPRVVNRYTSKQHYSGLLRFTKGVRMELTPKAKALIAYVRHLRQSGMRDGSSLAQVSASKVGAVPANRTAALRAGAKSHAFSKTATNPSFRVNQGDQLYNSYCRSCHGAQGRGDGPMSSYLSNAPRDLTRLGSYTCRSNRKQALAPDLERTLRKGTGGCAVLPLGTLLPDGQIKALTEKVRRLAMIPGGSSVRALMAPKMNTPSRSIVTERAFQQWFRNWWTRAYKRWNKAQREARRRPGDKKPASSTPSPYQSERRWREWAQMQGFDKWVRQDPKRLQASYRDWWSAVTRNPTFRPLYEKWQKSKSPLSFVAWLRVHKLAAFRKEAAKAYKTRGIKEYKRIKIWTYRYTGVTSIPMVVPAVFGLFTNTWKLIRQKSNWINREQGVLWERYLGKLEPDARRTWLGLARDSEYRQTEAGMLKYFYLSWRERKERNTFRRWREDQKRLMYMAWRGESGFRRLGCIRCHATYEGDGPTEKKNTYDLRQGSYQCGKDPYDLYRSISLGVGKKMPGLRPGLLRKYIGMTSLVKRTKNSWSRHHSSLWDVVMYVRLLSHDLPLVQGLPHSSAKK